MALLFGCDDSNEGGNVDTERQGPQVLYVGNEGNITWYGFDGSKGSLDKRGELAFGYATTFFAATRDGKYFYSVLRTINEMNRQMVEMKPLEGYIASFSIDRKTGALTELARRPAEGDRPTYLTIDKTGKFLFTANNLGHLVGDSVAVFPIRADGTLGDPLQKLRTGIRAHQIRVHPGNRYVYVPNIDSDNVSQFSFDETSGQLTPLDPPAVAVEPMQGPRHLDFHPSGRWVYLSNEYGSTVATFEVAANGTLELRPPLVSGLPGDYSMDPRDRWQSEILVHPTGRFVYAGQRARTAAVKEQTISIFLVNATTGALSLMGNVPTMGKTPRNFIIDPTGNWMVVGNQESNSLITLKIDQSSGSLEHAFGPMTQPTPYAHTFVTLP